MESVALLLLVFSAAIQYWPQMVLPTEKNPASPAQDVEAAYPSSTPIYIKEYVDSSLLVITALIGVFVLVGFVLVRVSIASTMAASVLMISGMTLWNGLYAWKSGVYPVSDRSGFKLWTWDGGRSRRIGRVQVGLAVSSIAMAGVILWLSAR